MKIISAGFLIYSEVDGLKILRNIEEMGRVCYKSEERITDKSAENFVKSLIASGHESVLEHEKITIKIICDRGVSHEIVRHRIASYSQESTRYCNYSNNRFGNELTFIKPTFWEENDDNYIEWMNTLKAIEKSYFRLLELGSTPEQARSILPNSLKTELFMTMNLRELRHFFKLRTSLKAHPQMREISIPLLNELKKSVPVIFDDIM